MMVTSVSTEIGVFDKQMQNTIFSDYSENRFSDHNKIQISYLYTKIP